MLMDTPGGGVPQLEQELHGLIGLDIRDGNSQYDSRRRRSKPLGIPLTGSRLLTASWILGLGISKAIYSNRGQSLISPTLDLLGGITFTIFSFWLAVIESTRPELCPRFFEVDLAPYILKFIKVRCRNDVFLWSTSVLPFLSVVDAKRQVVKYAASSELAQSSEDGSTQFMLGVCMAVFLFFLHGVRVASLWSKGFEVNMFVAFGIFLLMMLAHMSFLCVKYSRTNPYDSIAYLMSSVTICLYARMLPWAVPPIPRHFQVEARTFRHSHFLQHFFQYYEVTWGLLCIYLESMVMSWKVLQFPQTMYSSFFLCFSLIRIWKGLSAINFPPSVTSPWKAACGSVRSAARKATTYVLGVYRRFWVSDRRLRFRHLRHSSEHRNLSLG